MNGPYLDPTVEAQAQPRIQSVEIQLKDAIEGKLYGFATVPGARPMPIYTHTIRYDEEAAGDWFYANFPMSSLEGVLSISSFGYGAYDEEKIWLEPLERWLAAIANELHARVPVAYGIIGHETEAGMELPPLDTVPRRESLLVPENGTLRFLARSAW